MNSIAIRVDSHSDVQTISAAVIKSLESNQKVDLIGSHLAYQISMIKVYGIVKEYFKSETILFQLQIDQLVIDEKTIQFPKVMIQKKVA